MLFMGHPIELFVVLTSNRSAGLESVFQGIFSQEGFQASKTDPSILAEVRIYFFAYFLKEQDVCYLE